MKKAKWQNGMYMKVLICGDLYLNEKYAEQFTRSIDSKEKSIFELEMLFKKVDLSILNLEAPITNATKDYRIKKLGSCFKSGSQTLKLIKNIGANLLTLANNHIRDYGDKGVEDTLKNAYEYGIDIVGAGKNLEESQLIYFKKFKDEFGSTKNEIAIINVTENEFSYATENRAGANPFDMISILNSLKIAKTKTKHVILIYHGGIEFSSYPSPSSIRLFRFLAEQGFSAIIRHHSHCIQGYEAWRGVPIFYGLGNLLFPEHHFLNPDYDESLGVVLIFDENRLRNYEYYPIKYNPKSVDLLSTSESPENSEFYDKIQLLSEVLNDDRLLNEKWFELLRMKREDYLGMLSSPNLFAFKLLKKMGILQYMKSSLWKKLYFLNMLHCEAHREALIEILNDDIRNKMDNGYSQ